MSIPRQIACPTCGRRGDWFAGGHGPFCSRRCKLVDLGKWLGEEHVLSEPLRSEVFEPFAGLPPRPELDEPAEAERRGALIL